MESIIFTVCKTCATLCPNYRLYVQYFGFPTYSIKIMYGTVSKKIVHNQNENINCDAQPILNCKAKPTAREKESDGNMSSLL